MLGTMAAVPGDMLGYSQSPPRCQPAPPNQATGQDADLPSPGACLYHSGRRRPGCRPLTSKEVTVEIRERRVRVWGAFSCEQYTGCQTDQRASRHKAGVRGLGVQRWLSRAPSPPTPPCLHLPVLHTLHSRGLPASPLLPIRIM